MEEQVLYVRKDKYEKLLSRFLCLKRENCEIKEAWKELKKRTKHVDEQVIDDIYQFDTLEEEKAYLIGVFNSKKAAELDMKELEEKCYVAPVKKKPIRGRYDFNTGEVIAEYYTK